MAKRAWQPLRSASVFAIIFVFITMAFLFQAFSERTFKISFERPDRVSRLKTFTRVPMFEDLSHENDAAWAAAAMPKRLGFIYVRYNDTLVLERGISMFHAMHCLSLLRQLLQAAPANRGKSHVNHQGDGESTQHLHEKHMPHCLSYLAQVSLCYVVYLVVKCSYCSDADNYMCWRQHY